jgi:hypothetical protein
VKGDHRRQTRPAGASHQRRPLSSRLLGREHPAHIDLSSSSAPPRFLFPSFDNNTAHSTQHTAPTRQLIGTMTRPTLLSSSSNLTSLNFSQRQRLNPRHSTLHAHGGAELGTRYSGVAYNGSSHARNPPVKSRPRHPTHMVDHLIEDEVISYHGFRTSLPTLRRPMDVESFSLLGQTPPETSLSATRAFKDLVENQIIRYVIRTHTRRTRSPRPLHMAGYNEAERRSSGHGSQVCFLPYWCFVTSCHRAWRTWQP